MLFCSQAPQAGPLDSAREAAGGASVASPASRVSASPRPLWESEGADEGARPQDVFEVAVDNTNTPFQPRADHWPGFRVPTSAR